MDSIAIVGVGLIGGSLGLALRRAGFKGRIYGVSSAKTIDSALHAGAIDEGTSLEAASKLADVLYLAQPIRAILQTLERLGKLNLSEAQLVTDAGSTKAAICEHARRVMPKCQFLGGHPMAGKETRGVEAAEPNLFDGRTYVICPLEGKSTYTPAEGAFLEWLDCIGTRILLLSAEEHDRTVALTSHLPQLLATNLGAVLADSSVQIEISGPGLQDMTRLALSSYEIWDDILATNSKQISHALEVYIDKLTKMRENIGTQQLSDVFTKASGIAKQIRR